jgi:hypothetical protein
MSRRPGPIGLALLGLVLATIVIDGGRGFLPAYPSGDLLYHWGLTHGILRGELPPGGPYQGLPAYYPPGFHLILAIATWLTTIPVPTVTLLLGFAWLPVLPLTTYVLARRLTDRGDIALVAAALTVFGGAYDLGADRLWVNSLFLAGHQAYPLYPRDVVFGLLPLAVLSFLRALDGGSRAWIWAVVSGVLLGACALIQVQLLLPIPIALVGVAAAAAVDRKRRRSALIAVLVTGGLTAAIVSPWLVPIVGTIRQNGGIALDSADTLLPARFSLWDYPREFGPLLPLAAVGIGLALLHLRARDQNRTGFASSSPSAPLVLVPWFVLPWVLAVLYDPSWPLEDALRPQRLWLLASQPGAILAAVGLFAVATRFAAIQLRRPRLEGLLVVVTFLVIALPTTVLTTRLLFQTWTLPRYADLRLDLDHVPDFGRLLGDSGARSAILTYEDWSSLAWYETGSWVVAVKPPGYAKLAFDPTVFTGRSQATRRADVGLAFDGDVTDLTAIAAEYDAGRIVLARRLDRWGAIQQVAATAATDPGRVSGSASVVDGNGWDAVTLDQSARLVIVPPQAGGSITLEIRFAGDNGGRAVPERRFRLLATGPAGERDLGGGIVPPTATEDWQVISQGVDLRPGERVSLQADDPLTIQSATGFVAMSAPPGWRVAVETSEAVVLERVR